MKKQDKILPVDYGQVPIDPEPGFSAERNIKVIDQVIKESERNRRRKGREHNEQVRERTSAIAQYLKSLERDKANGVEKYFGKKYLSRLAGRDKLRQIKEAYAKAKQKSPQKEVQAFEPRRNGQSGRTLD